MSLPRPIREFPLRLATFFLARGPEMPKEGDSASNAPLPNRGLIVGPFRKPLSEKRFPSSFLPQRNPFET